MRGRRWNQFQIDWPGFASEQREEWLEVGFENSDYKLCSWLRDVKKLTPDQCKRQIADLRNEFSNTPLRQSDEGEESSESSNFGSRETLGYETREEERSYLSSEEEELENKDNFWNSSKTNHPTQKSTQQRFNIVSNYEEPTLTEYYENPISNFSASSGRFATVEEKINSKFDSGPRMGPVNNKRRERKTEDPKQTELQILQTKLESAINENFIWRSLFLFTIVCIIFLFSIKILEKKNVRKTYKN